MKKRLIALLLVLVLLIPAEIAFAATYYRVNTTSLQVRMQPSESSTVLASYRKDSAATIKSTKDGWSYVRFYNGTEGYVRTRYLSKASSYAAWVAYDGTSLRAKPVGTAAATATLAKGTKVTVLSHGASYDYVKAGSFGYGYIVNSRLSKKKVKASGNASTSNQATGGNYDAWVLIASGHTVNLYQSASTGSPRISKHGAGTKVHVIQHGSEWDKVSVGGNTGWMLTKYLNTSAPAPTTTPGGNQQQNNNGYTAYVVTANKKSVNVRKGNSKNYTVLFKVPYGAPVKVLKHNAKWDYIQYNGRKGYVENTFLQTSKPADAGNIQTQDPNAPATPKPTFTPYYATVNVKNLNFHRQKGDWSSNVNGLGNGKLQQGWTVKVLKVEGGWAQVEYNGIKGWVHKEYLTK